MYNIPGLAEEFGRKLLAELDYHREGRNTDKFRADLASRAAQATFDAIDLGLDLPIRVNRLLTRLERGDFRVQVDSNGQDQMNSQMQHLAGGP